MQEVNNEQVAIDNLRFGLLLATIFMVVIGVMLIIFSFAYIQDLDTLRDVPDAVWSFVCGRPVENGIVLPLLLTLSIVTFLGSGILLAWRWWLKRKLV